MWHRTHLAIPLRLSSVRSWPGKKASRLVLVALPRRARPAMPNDANAMRITHHGR